MLLQQGGVVPILYMGEFGDGRRQGYGVVHTRRGETFRGFFKDGVMWGPGQYEYPLPAAPDLETTIDADSAPGRVEGRQPRKRQCMRFEGMFNGRPLGR